MIHGDQNITLTTNWKTRPCHKTALNTTHRNPTKWKSRTSNWPELQIDQKDKLGETNGYTHNPIHVCLWPHHVCYEIHLYLTRSMLHGKYPPNTLKSRKWSSSHTANHSDQLATPKIEYVVGQNKRIANYTTWLSQYQIVTWHSQITPELQAATRL